uniref:Uncharacterized protein n=1 Tax=Arundo donax TaxID=35708 RepID=A0A0A9EHU7_ARUDO
MLGVVGLLLLEVCLLLMHFKNSLCNMLTQTVERLAIFSQED